uniref:Uncharacterized protein n=1 Tax=viral metagenome TaxID=1070528 RepID=A0A6M3K8F2_9ZZZZ
MMLNKSMKMTKDGGQIAGWYAEEDPPTPPVAPKGLEIEIDGKKETLTPEDVVNLKKQQASATQKTQKVASIIKACERYGVEPDVFLSNAESSMALIHSLMEQGALDEEGNLIAGRVPASSEPPAPFSAQNPPMNQDGTDQLIKKALAGLGIDRLASRLEQIEADQNRLVRMQFEDKLLSEIEGLERADLPQVFALAKQDKERPITEHAKEVLRKKTEYMAGLEKKIASKYGVDIEEFNRNKLLEQSADGGAGALFKGKKFSFKGGKDAVTPKAAMREFFRYASKRG